MVTGGSFQIEVRIKVAHSICLAIEEKFSMIFSFFCVKGQCDFTDCKNFPGESRYSHLLQSQYEQSYATGLQK